MSQRRQLWLELVMVAPPNFNKTRRLAASRELCWCVYYLGDFAAITCCYYLCYHLLLPTNFTAVTEVALLRSPTAFTSCYYLLLPTNFNKARRPAASRESGAVLCWCGTLLLPLPCYCCAVLVLDFTTAVTMLHIPQVCMQASEAARGGVLEIT